MVISENFNPQNKVKKKKVSEVLFFYFGAIHAPHSHTQKPHQAHAEQHTLSMLV